MAKKKWLMRIWGQYDRGDTVVRPSDTLHIVDLYRSDKGGIVICADGMEIERNNPNYRYPSIRSSLSDARVIFFGMTLEKSDGAIYAVYYFIKCLQLAQDLPYPCIRNLFKGDITQDGGVPVDQSALYEYGPDCAEVLNEVIAFPKPEPPTGVFQKMMDFFLGE